MAKEYCAVACMVMAAWAVPLLAFFGVLCLQESPLIDVAADKKKEAGWGCFGSALLYAATFIAAQQYRSKLQQASTSGREVQLTQMQEMLPVAEGTRR